MKLVIAHGNAELVKGMRKPKGSKTGQGCPREKRAKGTQEPISRKTNGPNTASPKRPSRIESLWQK